MNTNTISQSDVLNTINNFVDENNRPCPSAYLVNKYGTDVLDTVDELKADGILLGLRGRNGGLATAGHAIVAKRSEYALKKAAKEATKVAV